MKEFNCYGNLVTRILDDIQPGDRVEYILAKQVKVGNRSMTVKFPLNGTWGIDHVCFHDVDDTIVRTKEWLKLINY